MAVIAQAKRALDSGMPEEMRIRCLGMLCELHHYRTERQRDALAYADELLRIAPRGSGAWSQGMAAKLVCSLQAGNLEEFDQLTQLLGETTPAPGAVTPWALCVAIEVILLDQLGRAHVSNRILEVLGAGVAAAGDQEPIATALFHGIGSFRTAAAMEDPMKQLEDARAFQRISEAADHRLYREFAKLYGGMSLWYLGAFADAERKVMEASWMDKDAGLASAFRAFGLAWMFADTGRLAEARQWAERLVDAGRARQLPVDEGRGHWVLAEVLRRAGELDAADAAIQAGLAILRTAAPLDLPGALASLAAIRLKQGRPAEALAAAREGVEKYEAIASCGFFRGGFLRVVHAECLDAAGDHEAARTAVAAARARVLAIAEKISDPEYRKSFLEAVPENRRTLELARRWIGPDAGPDAA
jgi:tetratricopeptide (TPR) repeat protein